MKFLLGAVSTAALLTTSAAEASSLYTFTSGGWSDGGVFSGEFFGEDLDGDFQLNSQNGEVTGFYGVYSDQGEFAEGIEFNSLDGSFSGNDFPVAPGSLVFTLDGNGTIGDDEYRGVEGLSVSNGLFAIDIGPGPRIGLCEGDAPCGAFNFAGPIAIDAGNGPFDDRNQDFAVRSDQPGGDFLIEVPVEQNNPLVDFALATTFQSVVVEGDIGSPLGTESRPFFPDDTLDDAFVFQVPDRRPGEIFFIDPVIAVGYTYVANGNAFLDVQAPSLAAVPDSDGEYLLSVNGVTTTIVSGELINFEDLLGQGEQVSRFTITGIDTGLELDPNNPLAFSTGVSVSTPGVGTITQTPITIDTGVSAVPLPAGALLLLTGMGGLTVLRRRRNHG